MSVRAQDPVDKFWDKILPEPNSGCWLWIGKINSKGYGRHQFGGRQGKEVQAHRFSYELNCASIPDGLDLDHLCRVRCCVNPTHLEPVTRQVNISRSDLIGKWKRTRPTHCKWGHEFTPQNTWVDKHNYWHCRKCHAKTERMRRIRLRFSAEAEE